MIPSFSRSLWVLLVVTLLCAMPAARAALAQEGSLTDYATAVDVQYGDRLEFRVNASAGATLVGARLTAQVAGTDRVFSEVATVDPGTTISVTHELSVAALQIPPAGQITYFWDFQDQNGVTYQTPPATMWYQDTSVPWEWEEYTQADITVLTNGRSQSVSAATLDIATQSLTAAERALGAPYDGQMRIYVYPDLTALSDALRAHGLQIQDWVAAYAIPSQQVAFIAATEGPTLADTLQRDVPHEVSHLVLARVAGDAAPNVPGWFNEGMALNAGGDSDRTLLTVMADATTSHRLLPLEDLCAPQFSSLTSQSAQLAYAQSASLFRYVSDHYGTGRIRAMLEAFKGGASCGAAIEESLGIPMAKLESQWHNGIGEQSPSKQPPSGSVALWAIVWAISAGLALLFLAPQTTRPHEVGEQPPDQDQTRPLRSVNRPDSQATN